MIARDVSGVLKKGAASSWRGGCNNGGGGRSYLGAAVERGEGTDAGGTRGVAEHVRAATNGESEHRHRRSRALNTAVAPTRRIVAFCERSLVHVNHMVGNLMMMAMKKRCGGNPVRLNFICVQRAWSGFTTPGECHIVLSDRQMFQNLVMRARLRNDNETRRLHSPHRAPIHQGHSCLS